MLLFPMKNYFQLQQRKEKKKKEKKKMKYSLLNAMQQYCLERKNYISRWKCVLCVPTFAATIKYRTLAHNFAAAFTKLSLNFGDGGGSGAEQL